MQARSTCRHTHTTHHETDERGSIFHEPFRKKVVAVRVHKGRGRQGTCPADGDRLAEEVPPEKTVILLAHARAC